MANKLSDVIIVSLPIRDTMNYGVSIYRASRRRQRFYAKSSVASAQRLATLLHEIKNRTPDLYIYDIVGNAPFTNILITIVL